MLCKACHQKTHHPEPPRQRLINIYVDEESKPLLSAFKQICKREGDSMSNKIRDFIQTYVLTHGEGNPQWLLEKFMDALPQTECFYCHGHFEHLKRVKYRSGLVAPTCDACLELPSNKNCVVRVLGLIP